MTDDEVDVLYNYLQENYEYRDGELYLKNRNTFYKKGHRIGCVTIPEESKGYAHLMTCFYINKKYYSLPLSHAVYIFFNKIKPEYVLFKNKNRMDCSIENIESVKWQDVINSRDYDLCQGFKHRNGRYRVVIRAADYEGSLGAYATPELAKEIYLLAKGLLKDSPLTIQELREQLPRLHPEAKPPYKVKRILPFAFLNKYGDFDSKIHYKGPQGILNIYLGSFDTPLGAHYAALDFKEHMKKDPSAINLYLNKLKNKTGFLNIYESNQSIFAKITIDRKLHVLGPFKSKEEAVVARDKAKETGIFEEYDGNKILNKKCSLCEELIEIKLKNINRKKYCISCKKEQMKLIDKGRYKDKAIVAQLIRDGLVYTFGYYPTKEEANQVRRKKLVEYNVNKDKFLKDYVPVREKNKLSPEESRDKYIKHRLKNGLPIRSSTLNQRSLSKGKRGIQE